MPPMLLFLFLLQLNTTSNALPGEGIIKSCKLFRRFMDVCFSLKPLGGAQHILLDEFYLEYFKEKNEKTRKKLMSKIAIYTHIYMIRWKLEQNKEILKNIRLCKAGKNQEFSFHQNKEYLYKMPTKLILKDLYDEAMCDLLLLKNDLLKILKFENSPYNKIDKEIPNDANCLNKEYAKQIVNKNIEEIKEWMLSDLLHFFQKRQRLINYFAEILQRNVQEEMHVTWNKFVELFGFARASLICKANLITLGSICQFTTSKYLYPLAYGEYFENRTELGKWRIKIVLEFNLYDEWATNFFEDEFKKLYINKPDESEVQPYLFIDKMMFLNVLLDFWMYYNEIFWHSEKIIRKRMSTIGQTIKCKAVQIKEIIDKEIIDKDDPNLMLWWENGPLDTSLYRALTICIKEAVSEHDKKFYAAARRRHGNINELDDTIIEQFVICVGKKLKNPSPKGEILSKLHFDKMSQIVEEGEDFKQIVTRNKNQLKDFMDNTRVKKFVELLEKKDEYLSVSEGLTDSSDTDEETFKEANVEFEENKNSEKHFPKYSGESDQKIENNSEEIIKLNSEKGGKLSEENIEIKNEIKIAELNDESESLNEINEIDDEYAQINDELLELKSEAEFWIKQSLDKKAKNKSKNETKKREIKNKNENENEQKIIIDKGNNSLDFDDSNRKSKNKSGDYENFDNYNKENEKKSEKSPQKNKLPMKSEENCNKWIDQENEQKCMKTLSKIGMNKLSDLLNDLVLRNILKKLLENKLTKKCVDNLKNILLFVRAIHAKLNFIKIRSKIRINEILEEIDEKWNYFINSEYGQLNEMQFVANKLYFMHTELDEFAFDPSTNNSIVKFCNIIDENKTIKIIHKSSTNSLNNNLRITQFGSIKFDEFNTILSLLELHECSMLIAKGVLNFEIIEKLKKTNRQNEGENSKSNNDFCSCVEIDGTNIKLLENMLKQKKIALNDHISNEIEWKQFNLIRTIPKNRDNELQISNEIFNFISSSEIDRKHIEIMNLKMRIASIVESWTKKFSPIKPQFGLHFMMNVPDTNLLCVLSNKIQLEDLYGKNVEGLHAFVKKELFGIISLNWILGNSQILRIELQNIKVDLLPVVVPEKFLLKKDLKLEDDKLIQLLTNELSIYTLAGYRSGKYQMSLVPSLKEFTALLKAVKIWAKNRLIYAGIFGYFNGATLSVMTAKICTLFPHAPLSYLLYQFFSIYSKWNWAQGAPVMLAPVTPITLNQFVRTWPPIFGTSPMNVITPQFPEQNSAFNVNNFTLQIIIEELKIANQILSEDFKNWKSIFEKIEFKETFEHFAVILCSEIEFKEFTTNCSYHRSKIRENLFNWANQKKVSEKLERFQLIPQSEEKITRYKRKNKSKRHTLWLVGLTMKNEYKRLDLNSNLEPIYRNENRQQKFGIYSIHSFYTEAANLDSTINNL